MAQPPTIYRSGRPNYLWNFLGSSLKNFANALKPYIGGNGYKSYVGRFTQTGTSDPVVTVLYNDTGFTVNWTRLAAGTYEGSFGQDIPVEKFFIPGNIQYTGSGTVQYSIGIGTPSIVGTYIFYELGNYVTINAVELDVFDSTGTPTDWEALMGLGNNANAYLEFRIYN